MVLYDLFNDLQAQESTVLSNTAKNGGPLALVSSGSGSVGNDSEQVSHHSRAKNPMAPEDNNLSDDDNEEDEDDEEMFQQELALLTQKFNLLDRGLARIKISRFKSMYEMQNMCLTIYEY